jgi:hypothetical protein
LAAGFKKKHLFAQVQVQVQALSRGLPAGLQHCLDGVERRVRALFFAAFLPVWAQWLQDQANAIDQDQAPPSGYHRAGRRPRYVQGFFGWVSLERDYYYNGRRGFAPADQALGLVGTYTPDLACLLALAAALEPFEAAQQRLERFSGIRVLGRQLQRLMAIVGPAAGAWRRPTAQAQAVPVFYVSFDGTGVPIVSRELRGRKGKQRDGTAKTREAKLGCVFTQHGQDERGRPVRDPASTTYVGSFQPAADFGALIRQEALRRGMALAAKVVVIVDGAKWTAELARTNFPDALLILDFYHAMVHLHALAEALEGKDTPAKKQLVSRWKKLLLKDQVGRVIEQARHRGQDRPANAGAIEQELGYLENHQQCMRYGTYRRAGYFIGSGVVEAGCKTVVGERLKCSGMHWTEQGAAHVLALRCLVLSGLFDAFWTDFVRSLTADSAPE